MRQVTPSRALTRCWRTASVLGIPLALTACPKAPPQTASMATNANIDVTADQLQLQVFELGRRGSSLVVLAADSIARHSTDPLARRRALHWKLGMVPLIQEASLRNDPLVAAVDLAALSEQQVDYFTTGGGRADFGALQPVAVNAARTMKEEILSTLSRGMKNGELSPQFLPKLEGWTAAHPLTGPPLQRESILSASWEVLGVSSTSLTAMVSNMDRTLKGMTLRLGYLNETLADQMRWNAELMLDETVASPLGDSIFGASAATIRAAGLLATNAPDLIARERAALMAGVDRERVAAFADIDRQRLETLRALTAERLALEATIDGQRKALMAQVREERIATMRAADSLARRAVDRGTGSVTKLAWELTLPALVIIGAMVAGAVFVVRYSRRTARGLG